MYNRYKNYLCIKTLSEYHAYYRNVIYLAIKSLDFYASKVVTKYKIRAFNNQFKLVV